MFMAHCAMLDRFCIIKATLQLAPSRRNSVGKLPVPIRSSLVSSITLSAPSKTRIWCNHDPRLSPFVTLGIDLTLRGYVQDSLPLCKQARWRNEDQSQGWPRDCVLNRPCTKNIGIKRVTQMARYAFVKSPEKKGNGINVGLAGESRVGASARKFISQCEVL